MLFRMSAGSMPLPTVRFGRFELRPRERRLLAAGRPVALGSRAFDVLVALVSRAGALATKGELLDEAWPGLVVEEANLSVQVAALRKVLDGDLIATIPGRGYRFTGQVEVVPDAARAATSGASETATAAGPAVVPAVTPGSALPGAPAAAPGRAPRDAPAGAPGSAPASPAGLIGREDELAALSAMLAGPGCVTLVGPAGVGKTTLARALAAGAPQGAVWVDLAPLTDADQLVAAVARALGMSAPAADAPDVAARLLARLGTRLLVLDNNEHIVDAAAALVSQLLQADAAVRVLATSQLRLAVAGERVHRLEPLALPLDSDALDLHRGAVALFVERAHAADHRFHATPAQLPLLREICRQLDGLPLALEMAASRVPVLGLQGLAEALQRRFALLTGGRRDTAARHRKLQAALDWSHDLLSAEERRLYRLCGVFSGGFTLELLVAVATGHTGAGSEAAEVTTAGSESRWVVIERLAQLVDRSLVAVGEGDPPRYRLLETMREDARQRLAAAGEEPQARARLLAALAAIGRRCIEADRAAPALRDPLLAEHDNLRESIAWGRRQAAADIRADTVMAATATAFVAVFTAWRLEAMQWLESCEPLAEGPEMPPPLRVRWWYERSRQWLVSKHKDARTMAERALALARESGDELGEFNALSILVRAPGEPDETLPSLCEAMRALLARHPEWGPARAYSLAGAEARACDRLGDVEGLLRCRLRELELVRQLGDEAGATGVETNVVFALQALGRHEEALVRSRELVARLGDSDVGNAAYAWTGHFVSLQALGRFAEFRAVLPRAGRVLRVHGLPLLAPQCALVLAAEGRSTEALRVLGHARALFAAKGMVMTNEEVSNLRVVEAQARASLGDAAVDLCLREGETMDETAVEALMLGPSAAPSAAAHGRATGH